MRKDGIKTTGYTKIDWKGWIYHRLCIKNATDKYKAVGTYLQEQGVECDIFPTRFLLA